MTIELPGFQRLVVREQPHEGDLIERDDLEAHPLLPTDQAVIVNGSQPAPEHGAHRFAVLVAFRTDRVVVLGV